MDKGHILSEIRRTAAENGGTPLGLKRFLSETGIMKYDWHGKYWVRWSDALKEAGFSPNVLQKPHEEEFLLDKLCSLIRKLGHYPIYGELKIQRMNDSEFPNASVFYKRGGKGFWVQKLIAHCEKNGWEDIIKICHETPLGSTTIEPIKNELTIGEVYLVKSRNFYKIGRTNSSGRREYELAAQLPEKPNVLHVIKTDDPCGIEAYWHKRFADKRTNGEWFKLTSTEISAFKRRKFM